MENQKEIPDWREEVGEALNPKLKIQDGDRIEFTFLNEGRRYKHPDYKPCVIFTVEKHGVEKDEKNTWFVNAEAYGILNQIKALGKLTGMKVKVSRTGSRKSDTRYKIEKV